MEEIGGYIELDSYTGEEYYPDFIALNCGRNCLGYLLLAKKIKKILLPYFLCESVKGVCEKYGIDVRYYHIDEKFVPQLECVLQEDEYLYVVNYYGQIDNEKLSEYVKKYQRVVVDNSQAFFQKPLDGIDTIYTCRKYFGVPDGAYLSTEARMAEEITVDVSFSRMRFLLGRYEKTAAQFYQEYVDNNCFFETEDIKYMSKLTHNLLKALDYQQICKRREANFQYIHNRLGGGNRLELKFPIGPFMYPFFPDKHSKEIRSNLQKNKIYIPTLWSDVFKLCDKTSLEYEMAEQILPIPIDQRYSVLEMDYLCNCIEQLLR